ncbi:unnamed protein product, partial [Pleuronectes platessa]
DINQHTPPSANTKQCGMAVCLLYQLLPADGKIWVSQALLSPALILPQRLYVLGNLEKICVRTSFLITTRASSRFHPLGIMSAVSPTVARAGYAAILQHQCESVAAGTLASLLVNHIVQWLPDVLIACEGHFSDQLRELKLHTHSDDVKRPQFVDIGETW